LRLVRLSAPDIFISHARPDAEIARRFADAFRAEGLEVWWDNALQTGEVFDEAIETALRAAKAVVVLWSPDSVVSRWVRAEATVADHNKTLLPVTVRPCRRPVIFELTQTADLSHWKGSRKDPVWRAFISDVRRLISRGGDPGEPPAGARAGVAIDAGARLRRSRYPIAAGLAVLVLLVAGLLWWNSRTPVVANAPLRVAAFQAPSGSQAAQFAEALREDVVGEMGEAGIPTTTDDPATGSKPGDRPGMILSGSVSESGGNLKVFAQIEDSKSGVTVWSQHFEGAAANTDQLSSTIVSAAAEPLYELRDVNMQTGLSLTPDDMAKLMKGMQMIDNPRLFDQGMLRPAFEQLVAEAPNVAYAHAMLALTLVQDGARSTPDQRTVLFKQARSAAHDAFKISPAASGAGYDALYLISVYTQPANIAAQEGMLLDGLRNAAEFPFLSMRECQFLMSVGRNEEAWTYCQRAHAMRPRSSPIEWRYAEALKMRGESALAEQAIEQAARDYPDNGLIRLARFDILAFGQTPGRADALLPAMLNQSEGFGSQEIAALKLYLLARKSGRPADSNSAAGAIRSAAVDGKLRLDIATKALVSLGRTDMAFELLQGVNRALPPEIDQAPANSGTSFLLSPATAPLRTDPRFWAVANTQGLVSYWMDSGKWPDFCGKEQPRKQCQESAAKARAGFS